MKQKKRRKMKKQKRRMVTAQPVFPHRKMCKPPSRTMLIKTVNQILLGTMNKWTHPLPKLQTPVLGERPPIRMLMWLSQPRRESVRRRYRIGLLLRRAEHQRSPKYQLPLGVRLGVCQ